MAELKPEFRALVARYFVAIEELDSIIQRSRNKRLKSAYTEFWKAQMEVYLDFWNEIQEMKKILKM